jgi:hypothetical protein
MRKNKKSEPFDKAQDRPMIESSNSQACSGSFKNDVVMPRRLWIDQLVRELLRHGGHEIRRCD